MHRPRAFPILALGLAAAALAVALSRRAAADGPAVEHRVAFLYVSGKGPQAKAWYDGAPPSGVLVQAALDTFTKAGYHYAALGASGVATQVTTASLQPTGGEGPAADWVILLEK